MDKINDNCIGVQFNSLFGDSRSLMSYSKELQYHNINLEIKDINGSIINAALDFVDYEFIILGYSLLQNIIFSGCYDIVKNIIIKIWNSMKSHNSKIPFTIKITGIPTDTGPENISCKIEGFLTSKQKGYVLEKTFDLANNISKNTLKLKERSMFYEAFGAHVFRMDSDDFSISEIDIEEEIRKKTLK